jgi:hypothetical protein
MVSLSRKFLHCLASSLFVFVFCRLFVTKDRSVPHKIMSKFVIVMFKELFDSCLTFPKYDMMLWP